ncbi:tetratricopeptide repeat protein [Spirosoma rigui]|uniref:tetratricopeptide repeat protein n=1 Tax=Spirosoma rigui TaxID=564064 RepID=UPI0009B18433|nr:tetratricopeptide repeat protein [Spirosoma rigui]
MSVRINLMQWSLVVFPLFAVAQPRQLITSARSGDSVRQASSVRPTEQNKSTNEATPADATDTDAAGGSVNILPLFGERPKTAAQIDEEIHFLNDCDRNFSNRSEASAFFADRGWDYVADGQLDTATHRFNLSWLLNDHNADAYWGLGVVSYQKNNIPEAIRLLKKGLNVADTNVVLMDDLAALQIKNFQQKKDPIDLNESESLLLKIIALNPKSATSYQKLSVVNYLKADYEKSWEYFHQARGLDLTVLDLGFLNELLAKQPDPKGVFK